MTETTTLTGTHNLVYSGAPHDAEGNLIGDKSQTGGEGHVKCSCGWVSEETYMSGKQRKAAHAEHKANPPQEPQGSTVVAYTNEVAPVHFWRSLRKASIELAGAIEGIEDVKATSTLPREVVLTGTEEAREYLVEALPAMWAAAYAAVRAERGTNPELTPAKGEDKEARYARYAKEQAFVLEFCVKYIAEL